MDKSKFPLFYRILTVNPGVMDFAFDLLTILDGGDEALRGNLSEWVFLFETFTLLPPEYKK